MSCVEYESVEVGSEEDSLEDIPKLKPFIVRSRSSREQGGVVCRVADILDFELSQGLMPS